MIITWHGHATVRLDTASGTLLTDPVLGRRVGLLRRVAPPLPPGAVEGVAGVLMSHAHADHLDAPSLRRLPAGTPMLAPPAAAQWLRRRRRGPVEEVRAGDETRLAGVPVRVTEADHDGRRRPYGRPQAAVGYLVGPEPGVYFAGDTDLFDGMHDLAGRVDVALLPIWGWGPKLGPGHLDPERAAEAAARVRPRVAVPIHWGTLTPPHLRLDAADRVRPVERFLAAMADRAPGVDVARLEPGDHLETADPRPSPRGVVTPEAPVTPPARRSAPAWRPGRLRVRPLRLLVAWGTAAVSLLVAAALLGGAHVNGLAGAFLVAAVVALLNALLPPVVAALRLPFTVLTGFLLVLVLDAAMIRIAADLVPQALTVDGTGTALLVALVASAVATPIAVLAGVDEREARALRIARRIAKRTGKPQPTEVPGLLCLEIDGLSHPVLQRAVRDGVTPTLARWLADGTHRLVEWETDLSSQTGASQAGILLGANDDIPAFRWLEKETGKLMTCSNPDDCAEIERRLLGDRGLLAGGGTSRGNLLSGGADDALLTVSRLADERRANPGYRSFLADGANVTRLVVLYLWEVVLELVSAAQQRRRDVRPRGHRGGAYPFLRAGLCVFVRDLVVHSVVQDVARGVPAVYATFASYDEVAHHSGLERQDTREALRKLDARFAAIERACRYAPRPYDIVVLSDHGQTQGATFRQRNGYGLDDLVTRSLSSGTVAGLDAGDEHAVAVGQAVGEAVARPARPHDGSDEGDHDDVVVLGSGNLGLIYFREPKRRLTLEEIERRHPRLLDALREHPHVGFVLVHSGEHGPVVLGADGRRRLRDGHVEGRDPLAGFPPGAARHLRRTDGFANAPDVLVNSFYDPSTEEGSAFEELISFHGGLGGPQTRAFVLHPTALPVPDEPLVGAEAINRLLLGWRALREVPRDEPAAPTVAGGTSIPR